VGAVMEGPEDFAIVKSKEILNSHLYSLYKLEISEYHPIISERLLGVCFSTSDELAHFYLYGLKDTLTEVKKALGSMAFEDFKKIEIESSRKTVEKTQEYTLKDVVDRLDRITEILLEKK
jgi:hypothetical protein